MKNSRRYFERFVFLFSVGMATTFLGAGFQPRAFAETRTIKVEAVEVNGTKYWKAPGHKATEPLEIKVKKGDSVIIEAVSVISGPNNIHGFAIDGYDNVKLLVTDKGILDKNNKPTKSFEFVADKPGKFKIYCHLHPAHVGGTFIVAE